VSDDILGVVQVSSQVCMAGLEVPEELRHDLLRVLLALRIVVFISARKVAR
jgi:hypothetical protein